MTYNPQTGQRSSDREIKVLESLILETRQDIVNLLRRMDNMQQSIAELQADRGQG